MKIVVGGRGVEMHKNLLVFNSFTKWNKFININRTNKKKFFSFYIIFFLFSIFSKVIVQTFVKFKKKMVILKSPFHFKLFKHHIGYFFFTIRCWFFLFAKFLKKLALFFKLVMLINKVKKSQLVFVEKLSIRSLL